MLDDKSSRFMKNVNYLCTYAEKKGRNQKKIENFWKKSQKKLEFSQRNCKKPH